LLFHPEFIGQFQNEIAILQSFPSDITTTLEIPRRFDGHYLLKTLVSIFEVRIQHISYQHPADYFVIKLVSIDPGQLDWVGGI